MNDDSKQSQTIIETVTDEKSDSLYVKDVPTKRDMPIYYETHPIKTVNIGIEQEICSMPIPEYQTPEAAGFDLCASQPVVIQPKTHELIHTGKLQIETIEYQSTTTDNVLIQAADGSIKKRSTDDLLADIGGFSCSMDSESGVLSLQLGKQ